MLDTDVCVTLLRGTHPPTRTRLLRHRPETIGVSSIVLAELLYGAAKSAAPEANVDYVVRFASALVTCPFDDEAADVYGKVRADLERRGQPIGPLDTLIAAHALSLGATLVTGNEREFTRVPGLRVENWCA